MIIDPVYILIRTSGRPEFFKHMMKTIKNQTYKNIVTIVYSDDPRDGYVNGDIIITGQSYGSEYGNGTYNLYNNDLLRKIPEGPGWYHFIDDDDEYYDETVIEKMVENSKKDHINVCHVQRWNNTIWPKHWGTQMSYQTECFFLHTDHKHKAKWWAHKGGDHNYSKQLTRILPINWIDEVTICKAQEGKGHGKKLDKGGVKYNYSKSVKPDQRVCVIGLLRHQRGEKEGRISQGEVKNMKYKFAYQLEQKGIVKITHPGNTRQKVVPKNIYKF